MLKLTFCQKREIPVLFAFLVTAKYFVFKKSKMLKSYFSFFLICEIKKQSRHLLRTFDFIALMKREEFQKKIIKWFK